MGGSAERDTLGFGGTKEGVGHIGWSDRHFDAAFFENLDFRCGGIFNPADDSAGVAHATAGRRGRSGDKASDGFGAIVFDPAGGFHLGIAADLTDENDAVGLGIGVEQFDDIEMRGAVDRIAADTDASGLADVFDGELVNRLVG